MLTLTQRSALCALLLGAALSADTRAQWSTDSISVSRNAVSAVSAGGKIYFAGGRSGAAYSDQVDIYEESSGTWSTATLSMPRSDIAATAVGPYVLFAGGLTSNTTSSEVVDVWDTQTMDWLPTTTTLTSARYTVATAVGNKALFAGGYSGGPAAPVSSDVVDIYDADLGQPDESAAWSTTTLSLARGRLAAATAGDYALFAGGRDDVLAGGLHEYDTVDIYNNSTGLWSIATLSQARTNIAAASTGTRAYFAGGGFGNMVSDVVDIFDSEAGTFLTSTTLSAARTAVAATAVGNTVLFAGGFPAGGGASQTVDVLDDSTGAWGPTATLSAAAGGLAAATVGERALFAGGFGFTGITDVVEVYDSPWTDLGGGTSGVAGQPALTGFGSLVGGTTASVSLMDAPPAALMLAWISLAPTPFAALGGTVHAFPFVSQLFFVSNGAGSFGGTTTWPMGLPASTDVWFQFLVQDGTSTQGITLSNGLRATTP